jgi:hypothetical protein
MSKQIQIIQKQNDSIYNSLVAKGIQFERVIITEGLEEQEQLKLLNEENTKLKEVIKANKPASQPKDEKLKPNQVVQQKEEKPKQKKTDEEDGEEEVYEEPVKKFDTITNMEDMKRAFFNGDLEQFESIFRSFPFKVYKMNYRYNSDKDGAPDFSAKNLLKGFVRNFDDYRKYFMICFRCWKAQDKNEYKYTSYWIINTLEPVQNIIGSTWEDFEPDNTFLDSSDSEEFAKKFIDHMKKLPETDELVYIDGYTCIGESYVH